MTEGIWDILLPSPKNTILQCPTGSASTTFGSAWVEPMDIERASVCRSLALAKVKALKEPEQYWGPTLDPRLL
jgi:hypothetical protein